MNKPTSLAYKKVRIFFFSDNQIGINVLFCLSSCAMLHFEDKVSTTCMEGDLWLCFHWGVSRTQYIDIDCG